MRIGLLTTSFPRFEHDVAGCFVLSHARELARQGHHVDVLAPEAVRGTPQLEGVDVTWVPYLRPRILQRTFYGAGVPDNLQRDPLAWLGPVPFTLSLLAHVRSRVHSWDALVSHWALPCGLLAGALRAGRPHTAVLHSADLHLLSRLPAGRMLARRIERGATELRFVSEHGRAQFMDLLPECARTGVMQRSRVAPMAIEAPQPPRATRSQLRRRLGLDHFTLLFVGRLVPIKGVAEAIEALSDRADLELLVVGDGPERPRLEALARRVSLHVRFLGSAHGAAKEDLFHAADALLLPSRPEPGGRTEGAPLVVAEARARGLPVIAAHTGGIPELVASADRALLFEPGNARAMRDAVSRLAPPPTTHTPRAGTNTDRPGVAPRPTP